MNRLSITVALTSALFFAPALAGTTVTILGMAPLSSGGYQPRSATVSYSDLDITSAQGSAALLARLDAASRMVCGERSGSLANGERARVFAVCRSRAIADAVKAAGLEPQFVTAR